VLSFILLVCMFTLFFTICTSQPLIFPVRFSSGTLDIFAHLPSLDWLVCQGEMAVSLFDSAVALITAFVPASPNIFRPLRIGN